VRVRTKAHYIVAAGRVVPDHRAGLGRARHDRRRGGHRLHRGGAERCAGGEITFSCGTSPVTIVITSEKSIGKATTIDGGGLVTLSGQIYVPVVIR
jgi:hypothetical protein